MHSYEVPSTKAGALCGETSYVVRGRMTSLCVRLTLCGDGQTRFVFFLLITIKMEQFIETVRLNPCLWKVDEKNYKSQDARDIVWEEVSKKCNITDGKEAKRVWKKLRDSFRDALKRQNECKSGDAAPAVKRLWVYQKQMEFLIPYMTNRKRCSNVADTQSSNENTMETWPHEEIQTQNEQSHSDFEHTVVTDEETQISSRETQEKNPEFIEPVKKKKSQWQENVVSIMKQQAEKREARAAERDAQRKEFEQKLRSNDPLKEFFNSMYLTTAAMPPHLQVSIKRKIFDAVTEAELSNFTSHASSSTGTHGSQHYFHTLQPPQHSNSIYNNHNHHHHTSTPLPSPQSTSNQSSSDETAGSYFGNWNLDNP
ncbi:uncharacterized protein LOC126744116 [Anthonomus grandis grandis]|uniref:uncharacterized protein LOC126739681 n=2 Tax=Anthonomus grandis grandis TaxID=2921223 RepID=UPI00216698BB|nr:uncharacterized protein LOC126739681 [Anthonomus grandis grandis]XP_050304315.1 uncharacterized protein LOC126741891 [Anthonomus grandis grandis]XP_050307422.1 uncharacterized protein LOC126744116 [Anthonomus grandis grandis]